MKPIDPIPSHRILVIDDNAAIHEDFCKILMKPSAPDDALQEMESALFGVQIHSLAQAAFDIDCASQGQEGLAMVQQAHSEGRPYALAFVDGRMPPGWDGIETISHLWRESPQLQVVLCTAYADYAWQEIRRVLGESDNLLILKKPFDSVEVLQLAHTLTRKWELTREIRSRIENLDDLVRQRTEEKERTRALLEAALKHSPAGIIIADAKEAKILWANPAALQICDPTHLFSETAAIGCRHLGSQALRADGTPYPHEELPILRAAVKGETVQDEELTIRYASDQEKQILSNAAPILNPDGSPGAGILVFQDITDRKAAEKEREKLQAQLNQAQKMESVGLLAGGVAHDFNNMLSVILGHAQLGLLGVSASEPIYKTLKGIQKAAQRSADLTQQLLAFARKQTVAPKVLDLNDTVSGMLKMLRRLIGEDIDFAWRPGADLWPVRLDPSQINQVLTNLCVNARDAIGGVGKLTIETQNTTFDASYCAVHEGFVCGQYAMLAVSDDGKGIDKANLDHIFEPFYTTKEVGTGTGLGLATVYGIVKQNEGFIYVSSEPGQGTTFKIFLPRHIGEITASVDAETPEPPRGNGEMVLIVEDEADILTISKSMLETLGYTVLTARTPGEALGLAQARGREIQLLLTDVVMPEMNGRELFKNLSQHHPKLKSVFMSGYPANVITHRGVLDEGLQFIQKPFSMEDLASKIRAVLDQD